MPVRPREGRPLHTSSQQDVPILPALPSPEFLGGQNSSHAGPTFSQGPLSSISTSPHIIPDPTPPPLPHTEPPRPPSYPTHPQPIHIHNDSEQATSAPHTNNKASTNQTPYRLSLITKAKATAKDFLGKFFFGNSVLTQILPSVQKTTARHRDKIFNLTTGKTLRLQ